MLRHLSVISQGIWILPMKIPDVLTFRHLVENSTSRYGDTPALGYAGGDTMTYNAVNEGIIRLTDLLISGGIQSGDRVMLLGQNMPNWGVSYLAVTSMGAIVVPVLTDFSEEEIAKLIGHSEAKALIVSEKLAPKLKGTFPETLKMAVLMDDFREISLGMLEMTGSVGSAEPRRSNGVGMPPAPKEDDLAAILYTSGTTGKPKGVMLTHKNILSNAVNTLGIQNVTEKDRLLSVLPLPHTYECTIGFLIPYMSGAAIYYLDKLPTPAVLLPAMQQVKPTMMLTVPLIIEKVYRNKVLPKLTGSKAMRFLSQSRMVQKAFHRMAGKKIYKAFGGELHFFGIGGSKLDAATERFLRDAGFPYAIGYGLTETAPLLAGCGPSLTKYRSTGFCLPGQKLRIIDPDPHTGEGEIVASGPNIMKGYYKEPGLTKDVFTSDGWFRTGDLGLLDNDGYLYIKGRLKNIIISASGENIYPEDIEAVINSQPTVLESLVYELKGKLVARVHLNYEEIDQRYNEMKESAGQFYEQTREKVSQRLSEIQQRVNSRLNRFSRLTFIEEQSEPFEKTPTKKIKRFLYKDKDQD